MIKPLVWEKNRLKILDQRKIPWTVEYLICSTPEEVEESIKNLSVRGAPAIGAAAAFGLVLGALALKFKNREVFIRLFQKQAQKMSGARPTAVNLPWAVNMMLRNLEKHKSCPVEEIIKSLENEALLIFEKDIRINRKIGESGASLINTGDRILTHCNAGALATAGYGTALGVIRKANEQGKNIEVYVDETRPVLQGSRLTAWELKEENIPFVLVTDNMAGLLMQKGLIDLILVGADRITQNGDTANKIGTYSLAVLARYHKIPFYVAAPTSTFDLSLEKGHDIPIEERNPEEVTFILDKRIAPENIRVFNPSFDVTPNYLIDAIVTEKGIIKKPGKNKIMSMIQS